MQNEPSNDTAQSKYQVRFGWGAAAAASIGADAHLLVWVDVLPDVATGSERTSAANGTQAPLPAVPSGAELVTVGLTDGTLVAERVTSLQAELGDRCIVAIVAAGGPNGAYAMEDQLAAGAVIDALVRIGIDHTSPEAAAASAVWSGLRRAAKHLISACESAAALAAIGRRDLVDAAIGRAPASGTPGTVTRGNRVQG